MLVITVTCHVKPMHVDAFIEASIANHLGTRSEPGNLRWDFLRDNDDPNIFYLYEVYTDADALAAHQQTEHYLTWRERVADMMALPRTKTVATCVAPEPWH